MFQSWKIGRVAGVDLYLHSTFLLLLAWIGVTGLASSLDGLSLALHLFLPVMLFTIVVLHELGHALAARHYGIGTRDITLYPIGGVARLEGMPSRPRHEMAVAAAGPAVNLALAGATWLLGPVLISGPLSGFLLSQFFLYNMGLALFNLLPAFPMDGGRILRAYLTQRSNYRQATRTAARWGQRMAIGFAVIGLLSASLNLVLLGGFVWIAATAELASLGMDEIRQRVSPRLYQARIDPRDPRVVDAEYWEVRR